VRSVPEDKHEAMEQVPIPAARHPLPWRNAPSDGENHVTDANGRSVYDGSDAAEMFRLYGDEAQAEHAERSAGQRVRARRRRPRRTG
jgi:hypothetical protein